MSSLLRMRRERNLIEAIWGTMTDTVLDIPARGLEQIWLWSGDRAAGEVLSDILLGSLGCVSKQSDGAK